LNYVANKQTNRQTAVKTTTAKLAEMTV